MKRKLFSAILFGACLVASTSGLTSCKDYDDDISNLQSQIDKLATKEELQQKANELSTAINNAQQAADAAKKVAEDAAAAAKTATTGAEAAQKAADAAQAAADKAQKAADAAQAAADKNAEDLKKAADGATKAVEEIKTAMEGLATTEAVNAAVKVVADKYDAQAKELKALSDRLAKVEAKLGLGEGGEDIDLTEIQEELDAIDEAFDAIIGDYSTMVTAITVVKNTQANLDNQLDFGWYKEQANEFGKDIATETLKFTKDAVKRSSDYLVVRVSPVNADLSNAANNISLINSKGQELRGKIDVTGVERYDGMLVSSTRAASDQTGLWKITYKAADGLSEDAFKAIAKTTISTTEYYNLYAVSVKNVEGADTLNQAVLDSRRVISDYEVTLNAKEIVAYDMNPVPVDASGNTLTTPNNVYTNTVNVTVETATTNSNIKNLKNRGNVLAQVTTMYEKIWKSAADGSGYKGLTKTGPGNSNADCLVSSAGTKYDDRSTKANVIAKLGEEIKISFDKPIAGFYVTLDGRNALPVSGTEPSELNAWNSYTYEGVAKVKKEETILDANEQKATMFKGQDGIIKINSLYGQATGDEIGFRIFAVNVDGTLCDPDGIAFYVAVGEQAGSDIPFEAGNINIDKKVGNTSGEIAIAQNAFNGFTSATPSCVNVADGNDTPAYSTAYTVEYFTTSWGGFAASATKLRVKINDATKFKDGGTYKITVPLQKSVSSTPYTVKNAVITFTKFMPTSCPTFIWKTNQTELQALVPVGGYAVTNTPKNGILNFNNMFIVANGTQIEADQNYVFKLANTAKDGNNNKVALKSWYGYSQADYQGAPSAVSQTKYATEIANEFIDCTTPHALTTEYNYGNISNDNNKNPYKLSSSNYSLTYTTWSIQSADYMSYAWDKANLGSTQAPNMQPKNFLNTVGTPAIKIANILTTPGQMINGNLRQANLDAYINNGGSPNNFLQITKVETKSNTNYSITNEYYEVSAAAINTANSTGVINFSLKNTGNTVPNHSAKVWITVKDCFGHEEVIKLDVEFKATSTSDPQLASL